MLNIPTLNNTRAGVGYFNFAFEQDNIRMKIKTNKKCFVSAKDLFQSPWHVIGYTVCKHIFFKNTFEWHNTRDGKKNTFVKTVVKYYKL